MFHQINSQIDSEIYNLRDEYIEDNDQSQSLRIKLSTAPIVIKGFYISKYSLLMKQKYLNKSNEELLEYDIKQYMNDFNIEENNVILFFDIIQEKRFKIRNDQYHDLCKLSDLFEVNALKRHLQKYSQDHFQDIDFIINCILNDDQPENNGNNYNNEYNFQMENLLVSKINECFQSHFFGELPISKIHRILSKCNKETINCNLAFDFICKSIKKRCPLLYFINFNDLSIQNRDKLYNILFNQENNNDLYLYLSFDFYKSLFDENKISRDQIFLIEQEKIQLQSRKEQLNEDIKRHQLEINEIKRMKNQFNQLLDENKQLKSYIANIQNINHEKEQELKTMKQNLQKYNEIKKEQENIIIAQKKIEEINKYSNDPYILLKACQSGNIDVVKYLISNKIVDINLKSI